MIYKGQVIKVKLRGRVYHCALDISMAFIGGKWKAVVLWYLLEGPRRFGELKRLMPEITEKMLSLQLKALERDGLVARRAFAEVPPKVEYSLTREGETLRPSLLALAAWGRRKGKGEGEMIVEPALKGPRTAKK